VSNPRTRILLVTRNLPPLVGGMERLNWHMAEELAKVADVRAVGPEGSAALAPAGVDVREAPLQPLWKFLLRACALACHEARRWRPDIVLAGSGLTAPLARAAALACNARSAVYVHGLDITVKHAVYRALWLPAIRRTDRVVANSHATAELCRNIGVDPARIGIVHPGVDVPPRLESSFSQPKCIDAATIRARLNLGDRPLLVSVGRLSSRKGLREFVTHALPRIVAAQPGVVLLVVGDAPNQALHAQSQTPTSIQAAADAVGVGSCIRFLGKISDEELDEIYRCADVHVFPIRAIPDDPEGFGMVAVEAAARGLSTVAFATGGVVDAVAEGVSGHLVSPNDYTGFADAVVRILEARDALRASSVAFARRFAWPSFGQMMADQLAKVQPVLRAEQAEK
jgi:phosphatidylinositol alpha-1,6-mannosyltransferase